jgi:hypothetical protein
MVGIKVIGLRVERKDAVEAIGNPLAKEVPKRSVIRNETWIDPRNLAFALLRPTHGHLIGVWRVLVWSAT